MAKNCKTLVQVTQTLSKENKDIFHNQLHRLTMLSDDQRSKLNNIYIYYLMTKDPN